MHSKAKQTQTSEFGVENSLLQGKARRTGGSCSKTPTLQCFLGKSFYRPKFGMRVAGCMTPPDWWVSGEVTGQYSRNLVLSLKLPSSTCVGALVPTEVFRHLMYIPWEGTRILFLTAALQLLDCSSFLHFLTLLTRNCLNLLFGTQEFLEGQSLDPANKKPEIQNHSCVWQGPMGSCLIT